MACPVFPHSPPALQLLLHFLKSIALLQHRNRHRNLTVHGELKHQEVGGTSCSRRKTMKPERLRGWLRKYGNLGTLMVGGYLAIHYLSKRRAAMLVVCCLLLLSLIYLLPRLITPVTKLHRSPVMPPNPVVSSEPHQRVAAPPVDPDELRSSQTVMIGKDPWTFEIWRRHPPNDDMIQFYRNGQFVESVKSEELGNIYCGQNFAVRLMHFPTRYPVIEVRVNSGAGHGQVTRFYSVRNGQLLNMGEVEAECGGPVFRGRDRDRK